MVSPAPSSESAFVVHMDNEERVPGGGTEVDEKNLNVFDMGDGDFELWVNGSLFKTHTYLLKKFAGLKYLVKAALEHEGPKNKTSRGIRIQRDEKGVEDFQNMFKVLYASVVDGPFEFDPSTLVSALRIATAYDHPNLRSFAIKHLESISLGAIERIRLAREFGLASWEGPAYIELCERDDAITKEEATVLGIDVFVHVAKIREVEQRRRGRVVDAAESVEEDGLSMAETDDELPGRASKTLNPTRKKSKKKLAKREPSPNNVTSEATLAETPKPWFVGIPTPRLVGAKRPHDDWTIAQHFEVPACVCKATNADYNNCDCPCRISPCVYEAIKALQAQQVTQTADVHDLKETVQEIEDRNIPTPDAVSTSAPVATPVAEQVMKWLASVHS